MPHEWIMRPFNAIYLASSSLFWSSLTACSCILSFFFYFEIACKPCSCCQCMISCIFTISGSTDCFFNFTFDCKMISFDVILLVKEGGVFCMEIGCVLMRIDQIISILFSRTFSLFKTIDQLRNFSSCLEKICLTVWGLMRFDTRVYFTTEMILILVEIFLGI